MGYLDVAGFKERTIMPEGDVVTLEKSRLGYLTKRLAHWEAWIDARLTKRYAVPFGTPPVSPSTLRTDVPEIVLLWLTSLVTLDAYSGRGFNPSSEADQISIVTPATTAMAEVKEAAESAVGLFELPLRQSDGTGSSGVSKTGPLAYTENSPYVGFDAQFDAAQTEDASGSGTT